MERDRLAAAITSVATLRGEFTLRSGVTATEYFDKYRFESDPALLKAIAEHLASMIPPETDLLAGLELGGVPVATAVALRSGLPAVFVRKRPKEYGTRQLAEGRVVRGLRVLIIEDVVTSGGQVVASANDLRKLGATVTDALCVIDRQSGGTAALAAAGIALHSLFTKADLTGAATERKDTASHVIKADAAAVYRAFADPEALMAWLPPGSMTGRALEYDFREGGRYRIELTYDESDQPGAGKTTGRTDVSAGRFVSLSPDKRIVYTVEFESADPSVAGEMLMTWSFGAVGGATRVTITADNVPPGISKADHDAGFRASLEQLATFLGDHTAPG